MITSSEVDVEGSYNYFQEKKLYSVENFKMSRRLESHSFFFEVEILSRIETGEFLKIKILYELNQNMMPLVMKIEKSLGEKYSLETFEVNPSANELLYKFSGQGETKTITRHHTPKHYLSSPAVCTSAVFSLSKKFDSSGKTPITLVAGHDSWEVDNASPIETTLFAEFNNREAITLNIAGQELEAHSLSLFETDSIALVGQEEKVVLMLSKHYSIPYQLIDKNLQVDIKFLKRMD